MSSGLNRKAVCCFLIEKSEGYTLAAWLQQ